MKQHYRSAYDKLEADKAFKTKCTARMMEQNGKAASPLRWVLPAAAAACLFLCAAILLPMFKNLMVPEPLSNPAPTAPSVGSSGVTLSDPPQEKFQDSAVTFEQWFSENPLDRDMNAKLAPVQTEGQNVFTYALFSSYWYDEVEYAYNNLLILSNKLAIKTTDFSDTQNSWKASSKKEAEALLNDPNLNPAQAMESVKNIFRERAQELYRQLYELNKDASYYYDENNTAEKPFYPLLGEQADFWWLGSAREGTSASTENSFGAITGPFPESGSYTITSFAEDNSAFNDEHQLMSSKIHSGLDLSPYNKGAYATAGNPGTVVFAGKTDNGYGVIIQIGESEYLVYTHLYELLVSVGDFVANGKKLGPCATDNGKVYLHFSILSEGRLLDPSLYL